eukprot:4487342-Pleurochrysis_carterae.AAC.5
MLRKSIGKTHAPRSELSRTLEPAQIHEAVGVAAYAPASAVHGMSSTATSDNDTEKIFYPFSHPPSMRILTPPTTSHSVEGPLALRTVQRGKADIAHSGQTSGILLKAT